LKLLAKKVIFSISKGKKQNSLLAHLEKFGKIPYCPPWKKSFGCPWYGP